MAITIPVGRSGHEFIQVGAWELTDDILNILKLEAPPLETWLEVAKGFLAQGRPDAYANVLAASVRQGAAYDDGSRRAVFCRIKILCSLAEYQLQQARLITDAAQKGVATNAAYRTLLMAKELDKAEMLPVLCIGHWQLHKGEVRAARTEYEHASRLRCDGRPSVAGVLALAALHFNLNAYTDALRLYRQALRQAPSAPADVRIGIAACHFRLGDVSRAEAAYSRALELDPGCTQALLGLAVLALASSSDAEATRRGSQLLAQAFQHDPDSPHTLVLLTHFSLRQGFPDRARRLAQAALDRADTDEVALQAEAKCLLARALHAEGNVKAAMAAYQEAAVLDRSLPLAQLGLAQFSLAGGQDAAAAAALERLLEDRPGWGDALRVLGPLCPRLATVRAGATAARQFKEAAEREPKRAELWEMLGDSLAATDPGGALAAYTRAIQVHRKASHARATPSAATDPNGVNGHAATPASVPARLLNNAAVLHFRAGAAATSLQLASEALNSAAAGGLGRLGAHAQVTLAYNVARAREATGDKKGAEAEYSALLNQFPGYVDCHLRLSAIAAARGDLQGAQARAEEAAAVSSRSADSLAVLASVRAAAGDTSRAKALLEELSKSSGAGQKEAYAKLAVGNVHLKAVPGDQRQQEARLKAEAQLAHALQHFRRVLERDDSNIYAANGIGCVLAETGRLAEAREVFVAVSEAAAATDGFLRMPEASVNLGHTFLGLGQHDAAAKTYAAALQRYYHNHDERLVLYLAKAQYDSDNLRDALRTLCKAAHLSPGDPRLRFNLALVLQKHGVRTVDSKRPAGDDSKAAELTKAVAHLACAHKLFSALRNAGVEVTGIPQSKLDTHLEFLVERHQHAVGKADAARKEAAALTAKREAQRLRMEAAARLREVEAKRRAAEVEATVKAREAVAKEAADRLQRLQQEWKRGAVLARAAERGDAGAVSKGRQEEAGGMADAMLDALFNVDEEEEDDDYVPGQEPEGEGAAGGGAVPLEGTAALAAAGLVSSDEDDDDFDPGAGGADAESDGEEEPEEQVAVEKGKKAKKPAKEKGKGKGKGKEAGAGVPKRSRLQKRQREEPAPAPVADQGLDDEETAGDAAGKRARAAAALEDSEEEGAAAPPAAKPRLDLSSDGE